MGNTDFVTDPLDSTGGDHNSVYDGDSSGSWWTLTQGDVVFVTLACFVIVSVAIFAAYAAYRRNRRNIDYFDDDDLPRDYREMDCNYTNYNNLIEDKKFMMSEEVEQPNLFSSHAIVDAGNERGRRSSSSWRDSRRRSVDSAGSRRSCRSLGSHPDLFGSMGSNVSNQYKLAAIDHMRQVSSSLSV